ncbi:glycosyltransferase family 2 protein [Candidatus Peregrinibacteria bacterium]|nr:glycosyltransferase family 2 protein [Candidatus Peregrinibacteria bacterium]
MNHPKVTIGVLLFRDEKYLSYSLASLLDQDYENIEYIFRDQSPNGEVYDYITQAHPEFFHKAKIERGKNLMHSGGHNTIIREMKGEYYICASNDMLYPRDFVSHIIRGMEGSEPRHYIATCKLMQWDYETMLVGNVDGSKTNIVDSYGIGLTRGHHFYDIGQGKEEKDVEIPKKILGPSGALAVYHKKALDAVAYHREDGSKEYFDENLHYKNDVDLAYRLSWAGFPCYLAKDIKVYHDRQVGRKCKKSVWARMDSLKGHLITLKKNFDKSFSWGIKLRTLINLILRFLHALLLHLSSLKAYFEVAKLKKETERKKRAIQKNVNPTQIEALMS